jgi:hypothetical protein
MVRVIVPLGATRAWRAFHSSEWRETAQVRRNITKKVAGQKRLGLGKRRIGKENTRRGGRIQRGVVTSNEKFMGGF